MHTITFTDNDGNAEISATADEDFFIVVQTTADFESQDPRWFEITFDPDADSLNDDDTEDTSVSVQDSTAVVAAVPEYKDYLIPVFAIFALFIAVRRKRKRRQTQRTTAHGGGGGRA